ncbi:MAG: (d)CMP kinase [Deltaproteobacteria bacterium]|nr:(d)CMP kinase [Deltaproteobacteria bacterium]
MYASAWGSPRRTSASPRSSGPSGRSWAEVLVVTVDGPSGAGKTSLSRRLAAALGFAFLDTGALYRAVALACREGGPDPADEAAVAHWVAGVAVEARPQAGRFLVTLEGRDVEPFIRNEEIGGLASRLSAQAAVRKRLLGLQQAAGRAGDLVAEGRDMGTVVFPGAEVKFFLTATDAERAQRRWRELSPTRPELSLAEVARDMAARDERDAHRAVAPLAPAPDARVVDTTGLGLDQALALLLAVVRERQGKSATQG